MTWNCHQSIIFLFDTGFFLKLSIRTRWPPLSNVTYSLTILTYWVKINCYDDLVFGISLFGTSSRLSAVLQVLLPSSEEDPINFTSITITTITKKTSFSCLCLALNNSFKMFQKAFLIEIIHSWIFSYHIFVFSRRLIIG